MKKIAIVTPTYNRCDLLPRLVASLDRQTDQEFDWIIIDDGSTDGTKSYIEKMMKKGNVYNIVFYTVPNGGKSRALNYVFKRKSDYDFYAIVDSDDYLVDNAIELIKKRVDEFIGNDDIGGIVFRYVDSAGRLIESSQKKRQVREVIMTRFEHDAIFSKDDGCMGYFQRVIKEYSFPEFENEKYVGPTVLQMLMAEKFKIAFTNTVVGVAEYQEGGLTKSGRKLRLKNSNGMICYCLLLQKGSKKMAARIKYGIMAWAYRIYNGFSEKELKEKKILTGEFIPLLFPFGMMLAWIWKMKYRI